MDKYELTEYFGQFIDSVQFSDLSEDVPSLNEIELSDLKRLLKRLEEDFEYEG